MQGVTYSKQSVLVMRRALEHRRRVPRHRRPVRFPAALILVTANSVCSPCTVWQGREGELFLAGLQANERRGYTDTNIFVHCTLYTV